jgi:hypothetical protein
VEAETASSVASWCGPLHVGLAGNRRDSKIAVKTIDIQARQVFPAHPQFESVSLPNHSVPDTRVLSIYLNLVRPAQTRDNDPNIYYLSTSIETLLVRACNANFRG